MHEDLRKIRDCIKNAQTSQAISFLLALERSLHKQDYSDALIISAAHINLQRDRIRGIVGTSKFNRTIDEINNRIATLVDLIENAIHFKTPEAATIPPNNLTSPKPEVELIQFIGRQFIVSMCQKTIFKIL